MGYIIIAAILGLNATVVIWPLIYISHVLTSVIVSPENERRKVFFLHTIIGIIVILFLPFFLKLSTYNLLFIFPIIYVVFWIKKFGDAFYTFPKLILILLCLISLRFPINMVNILHFVAVSLGLAVAFYFFVLLYLEKMFTQKYLKIAHDFDIHPVTLAIAWSKQFDFVASTIIGATTPEQLDASLAAMDLELSDEILKRCDTIHDEILYPMG